MREITELLGAFVLDPDGNNVEAVCHPVTPNGDGIIRRAPKRG